MTERAAVRSWWECSTTTRALTELDSHRLSLASKIQLPVMAAVIALKSYMRVVMARGVLPD